MNTDSQTRQPGPSRTVSARTLRSVDALLATNADRIYRFCLGLCGGSTADAEDLAQDVFVLAWQHRESFDGRSALTTWLMRIAINRHVRLRGRRPSDMATAPLSEERTANRSDPAQQTLDRLELRRALDTLPPHLRAAFLLVKVEGMKYREAAITLGIPLGTVQSQVHEAVLRLRAALTEPAEPLPHTPARADSKPRTGSGTAAPLRKVIAHVL